MALAGGVPVAVPSDESSGFRVSVDDLEAALTDRTKVLLFVSPSNPTGAVYPRTEIEAIGRWAVERGLWVLTDEIYEHLVYGSAEHHSMPVVVPELKDTCLVVNGVAKTYAMTGWLSLIHIWRRGSPPTREPTGEVGYLTLDMPDTVRGRAFYSLSLIHISWCTPTRPAPWARNDRARFCVPGR